MFKQLVKSVFKVAETHKDIFESIYGRELLVKLVKSVIDATAPVHLLMNGPPACGKTEICKCIYNAMPELTIWLEGDTTTVPGIIQELTNKPQAKFIIYNEIGDAKPPVRQALLEILENGTVSKTTKTESFKITHPIWMIATTNEIKHVSKQLLNRFIVKTIEPYNEQEFVEIGIFMAMREGQPADTAQHIAESVLRKYGLEELRKCRVLARMAKMGTIEDVNSKIELI